MNKVETNSYILFHVSVDKVLNVKFLISFQSLKTGRLDILLGQTQKYTLPSLALCVRIIHTSCLEELTLKEYTLIETRSAIKFGHILTI